jgi:hypothetical protein
VSALRGWVNALGTSVLAFGLVATLNALFSGAWVDWAYGVVLVAYLLWLPEGYARNAATERTAAAPPPRWLTLAAWGYAAAVVVALVVVAAVDPGSVGRAAQIAWLPVVTGLIVATLADWISGGRGFVRYLRHCFDRGRA